MKWLDKYTNANEQLECSHELILADVLKELIELLKELIEKIE